MSTKLFVDESGDISFSSDSISKYFLIAAIVLDNSLCGPMKNVIKRKYAELYRAGWPREIEIKAATLHNLSHDKKISSQLTTPINGDSVISKLLINMTQVCSPEVYCIAVNKQKITNRSLRCAEYGIAYNYFSKELLLPLILHLGNCELIIDQRSKETHFRKRYDEYLKSTIVGEAFDKGIEVSFSIAHSDSRSVYGLQAIDYYCWALNRYIAHNDRRFFDLFSWNIKRLKKWYCD
jgi:hypothetical protein